MNNTALPWEIDAKRGYYSEAVQIIGDGSQLVALMFGENKTARLDNAKLIMHCLEHHGNLIKMLDHAVEWIEERQGGETHDTRIYKTLLENAKL